MKNQLSTLFLSLCLVGITAGCSTPAEKAEKYYLKGMELIEKDPEKAKLEFQNALQIKKNMTKALYALGIIAENKGDLKGTFALMNEVVEQDPKNINALVKTGQILLAAGKLDTAMERSNQALAIDKNNVSALNLRSALQLKLNDPKSALDYANKAIAIDPKNQDAYVLLASERIIAKDNQAALQHLDKALANNDKNLAVHFIRIKVLENLSQFNIINDTFLKLLKTFPDKAIVKKSYAQFLLKQDKKAEAEQQLRAIVQQFPEDLQARLDIIRFVIAIKGVEAGQTELESYVKKEPKNYDLAFALVNLYQQKNNTVAEDTLLRKIADSAGNSVNGYKAQSMIAYKLIRAGKKEEASKILETILASDKSFGQALTLRASLALAAKDYDAAIIDLRTVLRDSPEANGAGLMLANAHESTGSPELAEEHYARTFETSRYSPIYGIPYAQFLMRRKFDDRAGKVYEQMLESNPNDVNVIRSLAQYKISKGDYIGAQALSDQVKKSNEKNPLADQILGAISSSKNDFDGTVSALKRAHANAPNDSQPIAALVNTFVRANKDKEALDFIKTVIDENPNNVEAKVIQGQLLAKTGNMQEAEKVFTQVIETQPKSSVGYQQLAVAQQRAGLNAEAESTLAKGLSQVPNDFGLQLTQASIHEAKGRFEEAMKMYEVLNRQKPDSEVVANNLASLITDHGNSKNDFERAYNLALKLKNSEIPQFLDTLGWASYKVDKLDDAEKALKKAIEKLPEAAVFHFHLAKVYIKKNESEKAKQSLQNALEHAKNQPFSQKDEAVELLKSL